ncbi:succinate dehydrogenase, hydrophobic membrane anchor protein [Pseudooceanicola sp. LIPI14-2-Ac024]|uniref:succinate dehydrogenase, hydrophobic membrane anchor protein n=1 Tax=Pseudooceanicola sp. LIPI14-2-Ac024 TaxID=3344875 RepID=UPI0035CF2CD1
MRYLTDRKRAEGRGASGTGTEHHIFMQVSAVALAIIIPFFVYIVGSAIGSDYETVTAVFSRPIPAAMTALALIVGMRHFAKGTQMAIEDYFDGMTRKVLVLAMVILSYGLMAFGLFALVKLAL